MSNRTQKLKPNYPFRILHKEPFSRWLPVVRSLIWRVFHSFFFFWERRKWLLQLPLEHVWVAFQGYHSYCFFWVSDKNGEANFVEFFTNVSTAAETYMRIEASIETVSTDSLSYLLKNCYRHLNIEPFYYKMAFGSGFLRIFKYKKGRDYKYLIKRIINWSNTSLNTNTHPLSS